MTFVKVSQKTPAAIKKALFERKTLVWFNDLLIGKKDVVSELVKENIRFGSPKYPEDKTILNVEVTNEGSVPFHMEYLGEFSFHERATVFSIPPKTTITLKIKTEERKNSISLPFRILNAVIAPKKYLKHEFVVK
jgi:hypothetical protein